MRTPGSLPPREKLLFLLKTKGEQTAGELGKRLGITAMAVRQQLAKLEADDLVAYEDIAGQVGRPRRRWRVTTAADEHFPNSHAELSLGLLEAARKAFGAQGMSRLVAERTAAQLAAYRQRMPPAAAPMAEKLAALAAIRREEGYMAEWSRAGQGAYRLVEHHCPICAAAEACVGLCDGELSLFQSLLGPKVTLERSEHILDGARRCTYEVRLKSARGRRAEKP